MARGGVVGGVVGGIISSINNGNSTNSKPIKNYQNDNSNIQNNRNDHHYENDLALNNMRKPHYFGGWFGNNKLPLDLIQHHPISDGSVDPHFDIAKFNMKNLVRILLGSGNSLYLYIEFERL